MGLDSESFELFAAGVKELHRLTAAIDNVSMAPVEDAFNDAFVSKNEHRVPINVVDALVRIANALDNVAQAIREHG